MMLKVRLAIFFFFVEVVEEETIGGLIKLIDLLTLL